VNASNRTPDRRRISSKRSTTPPGLAGFTDKFRVTPAQPPMTAPGTSTPKSGKPLASAKAFSPPIPAKPNSNAWPTNLTGLEALAKKFHIIPDQIPMTVAEVALRLGWSPKTVYVRRKSIGGYIPGKPVRFDRARFEYWYQALISGDERPRK